ncbi:NUDIX hydrolase [Vibrio sp. FNV 38]|nr:NUDIX hydrolase [Vibrio sp. FNV 38]
MSQLIHQWKSIRLEQEQITLPNGKVVTHTNIQHPGAAVILPITPEGDIVLVDQYRPSLKKWLLELPAGTLEADECPLACAKRELQEETGFVAEHFIELGQVTPLAGFCDEIQHLFVATGAVKKFECALDEDEIINVSLQSLDKIQAAIVNNQLTDAKTIACISKAQLCGYL